MNAASPTRTPWRRAAVALVALAVGTVGLARTVQADDPCGPGETPVAGAVACIHVDDRSSLAAGPGRGALARATNDRVAARGGPAVAAPATAGASNEDPPLELVCDRTSSPRRVEVLYAHARGANDLPARRAELEDHVRFAQLQFDFSAFVAGSERAYVPRLVTEGTGEDCRVRITPVEVSVRVVNDFLAVDQFIRELAVKGYDDPARAYLVFVDDGLGCGFGTIAPDDDRADPAVNRNNARTAAAYTRIDEPCWGLAEAHELGHNLGAVQQSAPHSTSGSHCTDGYDAICYPDGSVESARYSETACPDELSYFALDCNNDDYYDPSPSPGSYLASHWNIVDNDWLLETFTDAVVVGLTVGPTGTRFDDVRLDATFLRDIDDLARNGVTRGCDPPANTRFCPTESVTREQMAAFLNRLLDLPAGTGSFRDVPAGSPFRADIAALAAAGITRGCNPPANTEFCPTEQVTREQMAAFLARALGLPGGTRTFRDVASDSVFRRDIAALASAGITRGCDPPANTEFCPTEQVTREQMAGFIARTGRLTR